MTSWGPDQIVDVNDNDSTSVAFYTRLATNGIAEIVEDSMTWSDATPPGPGLLAQGITETEAPTAPAEAAEVEEEGQAAGDTGSPAATAVPEVEDEVEDLAEAAPPDYDSWTLAKLHGEIDRRNKAGAELKVSGNKPELAARLREDDMATQAT
jgi:hypothetical protein